MRSWSPRQTFPLFPLALVSALALFHGTYLWRGEAAPRDGYRTPFAEIGYVLRYLTGQTPTRVLAVSRHGTLRLFHAGEIGVQLPDSGELIARQLAAAIRPTLDRLNADGVDVLPVLVPTKLSIYREELPYDLSSRGRWSVGPPTGSREDSGRIHQVLAELLPEALDLYEPFRAFRRTYPERLLYSPIDYHWTSLGSAVAVVEVARVLMARRLLTTAPQWLSEGGRPLSTSTLTDQYPLPAWYIARGRDFKGEVEDVRFVTIPVDRARRVILLGTSFSGGRPRDFLGQLRSVLGRSMEAFVRPNNGYAGGFLRMREIGFALQPGDLVIWEIPLCCLNLEGPGIPADAGSPGHSPRAE